MNGCPRCLTPKGGRRRPKPSFSKPKRASLHSVAFGLARPLFETYVINDRTFIPNYGARYRKRQVISTAFVESAVNQVVSRRFVKKQQMRWTPAGAHLLLQIRIEVLNGDWRSTLPELTGRLKQPPPVLAT